MFESGADRAIMSLQLGLDNALAALAAPEHFTDSQLNSDVPYFREWREQKKEVLSQHSMALAKEMVTQSVINGMLQQIPGGYDQNMETTLMNDSKWDVQSEYATEIREYAKEAFDVLLTITNIKPY